MGVWHKAFLESWPPLEVMLCLLYPLASVSLLRSQLFTVPTLCLQNWSLRRANKGNFLSPGTLMYSMTLNIEIPHDLTEQNSRLMEVFSAYWKLALVTWMDNQLFASQTARLGCCVSHRCQAFVGWRWVHVRECVCAHVCVCPGPLLRVLQFLTHIHPSSQSV